MILNFHHVGMAVKSISKAFKLYVDGLGFSCSPIYDEHRQGVRTAFLGRSSEKPFVHLELVEPLFPGDGEAFRSPICGFIERSIGLYHIAYWVDSLEDAGVWLGGKAFRPLSPPTPSVAFCGHPIQFFLQPDGQLCEIIEVFGGLQSFPEARDTFTH